jgi:hypothetical protein
MSSVLERQSARVVAVKYLLHLTVDLRHGGSDDAGIALNGLHVTPKNGKISSAMRDLSAIFTPNRRQPSIWVSPLMLHLQMEIDTVIAAHLDVAQQAKAPTQNARRASHGSHASLDVGPWRPLVCDRGRSRLQPQITVCLAAALCHPRLRRGSEERGGECELLINHRVRAGAHSIIKHSPSCHGRIVEKLSGGTEPSTSGARAFSQPT